MIDLIKGAISEIPSREEKVHTAREFLQILILKTLYDRNYFKNFAFVGGTALRLLYGLRRFSEDLDFSLINKENWDFDGFLKGIIYELEKNGFSLNARETRKNVVQSAMFKFNDLLSDLGLSSQKGEKLSVKLELDTNPPPGWNTEISLVNRYFVFTVTHFDLPSLFALKLHACFYRKYTKGRDYYDLLWYLGKKLLPNFRLLNNAIEQTKNRRLNIDEANFEGFLRERLREVDFAKVRKDADRFIEDKNELKLLDGGLILKLLSTEVA